MINISRFFNKVEEVGACLEWTGGYSPDGYGRLNLQGHVVKATWAMWAMVHGDPPKGAFVLHNCDNKRCVSPHHLYLGNHSVNVRDAITRGRYREAKTLNG